jgi:hypothetical protein
MENQYNLDIKSDILERQADFLFQKAYEQLGDTATEAEVNALVAQTIQRYYVNLGRPLLVKRKAEEGHLPYIEDYNDSVEEITEDIAILYKEADGVGQYLSDYFNYAQSEKLRIEQLIRGVTGLVNDLNLIANDTDANSIYFRDSFEDSTKVEPSMIMGTPAQVSTIEGIVTLARDVTINRSPNSSIKSITGNGDAGTYHLVRETTTTDSNGNISDTYAFVSDQIPNDQPDAILDGRPDTIFEYEMVNCSSDDIINTAKGYDFDFVKGAQQGDKLRVKLVIELEKAEDVNWININPYNPAYSTGKVTVYSIRTSEDGFDYQGLYEGGSYIIDSEINTTAQTYRADAIFDGSNSFTDSKFAGQGVWAFPTRSAKYIEVVLDQNESYEEMIGHVYYLKVKKDSDGNSVGTPVRVRESDVPDAIQKSDPGKFALDGSTDIIKSIEGFVGWRYAIGLRDINIMSYQFKDKSEFVSTSFSIVPDGQTGDSSTTIIKEIMLYVNEKIPQSYLSTIATSNDWIQYFISIDDVNWHRISPQHHQPVASAVQWDETKGTGFPPKIYEINGNMTDLQSSFQLYKGYLTSDTPVKSVRLKVIMSRPTDIDDAISTTPILEDYAIRVITEEQTQ